MKAITLFNGEGLFSFDKLIEISAGHISHAKKDRTYLTRFSSPKWILSEVYGQLKKKGELPELSKEKKTEIWKEANGDKMLAFSLYVIEIL